MTDEEAEELFSSIESELETVQSETEVIDWKRKNGYDFEKFIVSRCPAKFEIKQWTSDKFVEGKIHTHDATTFSNSPSIPDTNYFMTQRVTDFEEEMASNLLTSANKISPASTSVNALHRLLITR